MKRTAVTEYGTVRGMQGCDARITVYKGIPFAAPPVGENRWKAPKPPKAWEGEKECYTFGPIPVQDTPGMGDDLGRQSGRLGFPAASSVLHQICHSSDAE